MIQFVPRSTHWVMKGNQFMLCRTKVVICCEIDTKLCEQSLQFLGAFHRIVKND